MQERALKTKNKILQTSIEEFAAKGFHGVRMDELAIKAGVNKQRIYAYYQSKEILFAEVLKSCYEKIIFVEEPLKDLLEKDIPFLGEIILKQYVKFHEAHPEFWRLLTWENISEGAHLQELSSLRSTSMVHIKKLYQKGQTLGHFKKEVSFDTFIYTMTALSYFMFSNRHTMAKMFELDLGNQGFQSRLISEALKMIGMPEKTKGL
jgi:AcrR family transcriptional regulator